MRTCSSCGATLRDSQKFCDQCGHNLEGIPAQTTPGNIPQTTWTGKAPLAKNPEVLRGYLILPVLTLLIGGVLALFTANIYVLYMFLAIVVVLIVLFLTISIIMEWATHGGLEIDGIVNSEGVARSVGKTSRNIGRGGLILGSIAALGGSRSWTVVMGGSLISLSQERNSIRWNDIRSVRTYPKERLIVVRDMSMINPVALYCTEENYGQVLDIIRKHAPQGTKFS